MIIGTTMKKLTSSLIALTILFAANVQAGEPAKSSGDPWCLQNKIESGYGNRINEHGLPNRQRRHHQLYQSVSWQHLYSSNKKKKSPVIIKGLGFCVLTYT